MIVDVEKEEIEDSDETSISGSGVLTPGSNNDGPETGILTDVERFGYRIYFDFV